MVLLAACLAIFAVGALLLAAVTALAGPRKANRVGAALLPDAVRTGATGGLLTALEGVENRWLRFGLLLLAAIAFMAGAALVLLAF